MLVQHTVTTSNVYSISSHSTERKVSDTQAGYGDAGWSPKGGRRSGADTWVPSSCCEVHASTRQPRGGGTCPSARLLTCYPGGGGGGQKRLLQDCLGHRPPVPTNKDPKLFYFNCKLLHCNKTLHHILGQCFYLDGSSV